MARVRAVLKLLVCTLYLLGKADAEADLEDEAPAADPRMKLKRALMTLMVARSRIHRKCYPRWYGAESILENSGVVFITKSMPGEQLLFPDESLDEALAVRQSSPDYHVTFDFLSRYTVTKIGIANTGVAEHDVKSFTLLSSDGPLPLQWTEVVKVQGVKQKTGHQIFKDFEGTGRYWKVRIDETHGGGQPWLTEIELYGSPEFAQNLGAVKQVWKTFKKRWIVDSSGGREAAWVAMDGDLSTHWDPQGFPQFYNHWYITIEARFVFTVDRFRLTNYGDTEHDVKAFKLRCSETAKPYNWKDVTEQTDVQAGTRTAQEFKGFEGTGQHWQVIITQTHSGLQPWVVNIDFFGKRKVEGTREGLVRGWWFKKVGRGQITDASGGRKGAFKAFDSKPKTYWEPKGFPANYNKWNIIISFHHIAAITKIRITNSGDTDHDVKAFKLQCSQTNSPYDWKDVAEVTDVAARSTDFQTFERFEGIGQFWQLVITETHSGKQPRIAEIQFYGQKRNEGIHIGRKGKGKQEEPFVVPEPTCHTKADVFLLIDGATPKWHLPAMRQFVTSLAAGFDIGNDATRIGVAQYTRRPTIVFGLGDHEDRQGVLDAIEELQYVNRYGSNEGRALMQVFRKGFKHSRPGAKKVMILITRSRGTDQVAEKADKIKQDAIIFTVGLGRANPTSLKLIASNDNYVATVKKFDDLDKIRDEVLSKVCQAQLSQRRSIADEFHLTLQYLRESADEITATIEDKENKGHVTRELEDSKHVTNTLQEALGKISEIEARAVTTALGPSALKPLMSLDRHLQAIRDVIEPDNPTREMIEEMLVRMHV